MWGYVYIILRIPKCTLYKRLGKNILILCQGIKFSRKILKNLCVVTSAYLYTQEFYILKTSYSEKNWYCT